jgi:PAS domain S-box-containing protein
MTKTKCNPKKRKKGRISRTGLEKCESDYIDPIKTITELNKFNKNIIDGISDEVLVVDPKTRNIISANKAVLRRTGLSLQQIKKKKCYEIYNTEKKMCSSCLLAKTLVSCKKEEHEVVVNDANNNLTLYFNLSTHPVTDESGKIVQIVHISTNITAKKNYEKKLSEMNEKLMMLFKTSAKLQESLELEDNLNTALHTFESLGYDRVRIYLMENNMLVGAKSNHINEAEFRNISIPLNVAYTKAFTCIKSGKPVIENTCDVTTLGKKLGKTGRFESASLPLMSKTNCQGMISIDNKYSKAAIEENELKILMVFANQIAVAVENAYFHRKDLKQINELRALYDISSAITSTLDLEKLLSTIVIKIVKLLRADICTVLLLDDTKQILVPCASFDIKNMKGKKETTLEVSSSLSGKAILNNSIIYIKSVKDEKIFRNKIFAKEERIVSMLSIPLYIEGQPIGVINIYTRKERAFTADEKELLRGLSNHAAMIIKNSQLYGRIKIDKDHFSALVDISEAINSTLDTHQLLEKMLDKTISFTTADFGFIMLIKDDYLEVKLCKNYAEEDIKKLKLKIGKGIIGYVAKSKKPEIVADVRMDKRYIKVSNGIMSMAVIPLLYKNEVIGILNLESTKLDNFKYFKKSLDILTNHFAVAIENSKLYDEVRNFNIRLKDEIKLATQELREKNIELQKLDQHKSDFVSNVSHELRTPLTSINGYTKLMIMEKLGKLNARQMQSLKIIEEEGDRLTRLINEVLDLSKLEAGKVEIKLEKFDMSILAAESIEMLLMTAKEKEIEINLNRPKDNAYLFGGKDLIKQVFINLINNALKFTDKGGRIDICVRKKGKNIEVSVSDTGKGIPKDYIPKLFNKFVQVDGSMTREHGGTGLGLVIVKHILTLHNGSISVKSELGKGSTFTFSVPIATKLQNDEDNNSNKSQN